MLAEMLAHCELYRRCFGVLMLAVNVTMYACNYDTKRGLLCEGAQ